jgi:hypothetical protein
MGEVVVVENRTDAFMHLLLCWMSPCHRWKHYHEFGESDLID